MSMATNKLSIKFSLPNRLAKGFLLTMLLLSGPAGRGETVPPVTLQLEPGEKWWGGAVMAATSMPFGTKPFAHDLLGKNLGNQTVPLLISQHGRYVWCDDPFKFEFKNGTLVLTPHSAPIQTGTSGST